MRTHCYEHLPDRKFALLEQQIIFLENNIITPFCKKNLFNLDKDEHYNETLTMNLHRVENDMTYHIGFYYLDRKGEALFKFYFSKYYDTVDNRYSKRVVIEDAKSIEFIGKDLDFMLEKSLETMKTWSKDELNKITQRPPFPGT